MKSSNRRRSPLPRKAVKRRKAHLLFAEIYLSEELQYYFRLNLN